MINKEKEMKKLMFAAVACAAFGAFAGDNPTVQSANVVGYQNYTPDIKDMYGEEMSDGCVFITPTFQKIDGTTNTVQEIQMDKKCDLIEANIQLMGADSEYFAIFQWVPQEYCGDFELPCPEGKNGVWAIQVEDEEGEFTGEWVLPGEEGNLVYGDMVQLWVADSTYTFNFAGQVTDAVLNYPFDFSEEADDSCGCRYIGNPFPTPVSIQDFQMDKNCDLIEANIQMMSGDTEYYAIYQWVPQEYCGDFDLPCPAGKNGVWAIQIEDEEGEYTGEWELVTLTVNPGDGFQVWAQDGNVLTVLCPFELNK